MKRDLRTLFVPLILLVALGVRLAVILTAFFTPEGHAGDTWYYVTIALNLPRLGLSPGGAAAAATSTGPLYPLFLAPFFNLFSSRLTQVMATRVAQGVLDTATVYFLYRSARLAFNERTGRLAMVIQALDLRYILQTGLIATETLFIALFAVFMWVYLEAVERQNTRCYFGAGALLGLASLTRPIPLLFPVVLVAHAWTIRLSHSSAWAGLARLLLGMGLLVVPWIVRDMIVTGGEFIPVADTAASHLWMGTRDDSDELSAGAFDTVEDSTFNQARQSDLGESGAYVSGDYFRGALRNILTDPGGWFARMLRDTVGALLQPYGTIILTPPGAPSFRSTALEASQGQISLGEFLQRADFWRKLAIYIFHYFGLLGGVIGLGIAARSCQQTLPLSGWIVYGIAVAAPLLIEPRYIFPVMPYLMLFAAYAATRVLPKGI